MANLIVKVISNTQGNIQDSIDTYLTAITLQDTQIVSINQSVVGDLVYYTIAHT